MNRRISNRIMLEECMCAIQHILKENGMKGDEVNKHCVYGIITKSNLNTEHIIGMLNIAIHFRNVAIDRGEDSCRNYSNDHGIIPICLIASFTRQFFDYVEELEISDAIERLIRVAFRGNEDFSFSNKTHVSAVIRKAIKIAEEHDLHTIDDFVGFLEGVDEDILHLQEEILSGEECCSSVAC